MRIPSTDIFDTRTREFSHMQYDAVLLDNLYHVNTILLNREGMGFGLNSQKSSNSPLTILVELYPKLLMFFFFFFFGGGGLGSILFSLHFIEHVHGLHITQSAHGNIISSAHGLGSWLLYSPHRDSNLWPMLHFMEWG